MFQHEYPDVFQEQQKLHRFRNAALRPPKNNLLGPWQVSQECIFFLYLLIILINSRPGRRYTNNVIFFFFWLLSPVILWNTWFPEVPPAKNMISGLSRSYSQNISHSFLNFPQIFLKRRREKTSQRPLRFARLRWRAPSVSTAVGFSASDRCHRPWRDWKVSMAWGWESWG